MDDVERDKFLKDEYMKLQDQYEDYDRRSLTIKGWISAGAAGAIALGFQKGESPVILLVVAGFALCFWYLEASWKIFQYALRLRIQELERHFRGEIIVVHPLQIYAKWFERYARINGTRQLIGAAMQGFVMLPYALIIVSCLALYTYAILRD
ncbi:hypothetical protein [Sandaracinobacteroides saxicola]|uniref:Uncharacterized protein n=1 Tax=Sandaracinobacteroides saxicola TaxID=2759707 RepID=A0A7G5IG09_9SPHN|nr:hypothetical protein [Sandaracinobacteroides saxicola]QMW22301.1 hypothetical protein H3309_13190 [Sandaracinobacteroides saxicola]